jgi:two-component system chemotaxis response regulator CheY
MADCLLIDDSRLARRICRALLEQAGYRVTEAVDGAGGLAQALAQPFDVILVDQFMPVMEGLDFIRAYRERARNPRTPILLCTSDAAPALLRAARELGAAGYLNKPYTAGALARQLDDLQFAPN